MVGEFVAKLLVGLLVTSPTVGLDEVSTVGARVNGDPVGLDDVSTVGARVAESGDRVGTREGLALGTPLETVGEAVRDPIVGAVVVSAGPVQPPCT